MRALVRSIALDTSAFVALLSKKDPWHGACMGALNELPERVHCITTGACLVESTYLLPPQQSVRQQLQLLMETLDVQIVPLDQEGAKRVFWLMDKYADLPMDFADATLVVAAERSNVRHVFTLDQRDFAIYRPSHCKSFKLLPSSLEAGK